MNAIGEGDLSDVKSHFAQSKPGVPLAPYRHSESKEPDDTATITMRWYPLIETGGVPCTGFKLFMR